MTTKNAYATLSDYKAFVTMRGQTASFDALDDIVMETILSGVSRYIERQSGRSFTPYIETRYFDVPTKEVTDDLRELELDGDLLEVLTLTNGDGTVIPSTEYTLRPKNRSPYRVIRLKDNSTFYWASDGAGDVHDVIEVSGLWGYHDRYATDAWETITTTAEALDASETGIDLTSGALCKVGQLLRVENELMYVTGIAANTATVVRGVNGSTAATHDTAKDAKVWTVQADINESCLQIAQNVYSMRSGQSSAGRITVNAAGIVIRPEEVPPMAQTGIVSYRMRT